MGLTEKWGRYPNAHYVTRMLPCYLLRNQSKKWSKSDIGPLNIRSACLKELYVLLGKQLLKGHGTVASHQLYLDMIPSQGFSCYLTKEKYLMLMSRTFFIISTAFVLEFWICDICYASWGLWTYLFRYIWNRWGRGDLGFKQLFNISSQSLKFYSIKILLSFMLEYFSH